MVTGKAMESHWESHGGSLGNPWRVTGKAMEGSHVYSHIAFIHRAIGHGTAAIYPHSHCRILTRRATEPHPRTRLYLGTSAESKRLLLCMKTLQKSHGNLKGALLVFGSKENKAKKQGNSLFEKTKQSKRIGNF